MDFPQDRQALSSPSETQAQEGGGSGSFQGLMQNASSLGETKLTRMILEIRNVNELGFIFSYSISCPTFPIHIPLSIHNSAEEKFLHLTLGIYIF